MKNKPIGCSSLKESSKLEDSFTDNQTTQTIIMTKAYRENCRGLCHRAIRCYQRASSTTKEPHTATTIYPIPSKETNRFDQRRK